MPTYIRVFLWTGMVIYGWGGYRDERESSSMRKREEERIHCRRCVCVSNVLVGVCSSEF